MEQKVGRSEWELVMCVIPRVGKKGFLLTKVPLVWS